MSLRVIRDERLASQTRSQRQKASAGFTLIELVLVVALMLLLAGAVILNVGSLDSHSRLEEGALQVETLFRYARAQSANTGRQVRIVFGSDPLVAAGLTADAAGLGTQTNLPPGDTGTSRRVQVLWEPDPVGAPGRFEALPGAALLVEQVNDLVKVQAAGEPGTVASQAGGFEMPEPLPDEFEADEFDELFWAEEPTSSTPPLTCYPDGSSDSMDILLAAANGEDQRLALVTLSGLSGRTRHRIFAPTADLVSPAADPDEADLWPDP